MVPMKESFDGEKYRLLKTIFEIILDYAGNL